jgi:hypothetical protein
MLVVFPLSLFLGLGEWLALECAAISSGKGLAASLAALALVLAWAA